jgi:hypothetical protein
MWILIQHFRSMQIRIQFRIWDPGWEKIRIEFVNSVLLIRDGNIQIREKHPGSATLLKYFQCQFQLISLGFCTPIHIISVLIIITLYQPVCN